MDTSASCCLLSVLEDSCFTHVLAFASLEFIVIVSARCSFLAAINRKISANDYQKSCGIGFFALASLQWDHAVLVVSDVLAGCETSKD